MWRIFQTWSLNTKNNLINYQQQHCFYHYLAKECLLTPSSFPVLQPLILLRHDLFLLNSGMLLLVFCHSWISLICLIYLSLSNLCFSTMRFMTNISFLVKSMFFYHEIHDNVFESSKWSTFQSGYTNQWCNLTLARHFWATKVCLWASKTSKICLFGCPTGQATFWKANFENCSGYSLIKWY